MGARRDTIWSLMLAVALFAALFGLLVDPFFGPRIQALPKTIRTIATEAVETPKREEAVKWNRELAERRIREQAEARLRNGR